jgi:hypothetical protein
VIKKYGSLVLIAKQWFVCDLSVMSELDMEELETTPYCVHQASCSTTRGLYVPICAVERHHDAF